ncbi:MAG: RNA-guided endonuclease InsQ/TnpB family protein [Actinomycetota bacterium]
MATTVHRSARIRVRATRAQRRRLLALMEAAGDVWAWVIDCNRTLASWGCRPVVNFQALCRELTGTSFGELPRLAAEDVLKRYSHAWFAAAKRRAMGQRAGFPRRKRRLVPVRFRAGTFAVSGRCVRLATARGSHELWVRLARDVPYDPGTLRAVTVVVEAAAVYLDVTAELKVEEHGLDPARIAGVDLGIIHPFAAASGNEALVVSGRAIRAEGRMHLADTKARARKMSPKAPARGRRGSRRWKRLRARQRCQEARHRRRVRCAQHRAAKEVVEWAKARGVGTLVVGDPTGICDNHSARHHNLRLRQWRRTHLMAALRDKAQRAGMRVVLIDERGSSSICPECRARVPKPRGRSFVCPTCGFSGHRDVVGARNIAASRGGITSSPTLVTHRRAGAPPARRDRRRHLYDRRRSCLVPGLPGNRESLAEDEPLARIA